MANNTTNSFVGGMIMDANNLAQNVATNQILTNVLNGTILTYNGNEFLLLNDFGNGRVHTAMLPSGYVPLGMKEYGGIIYVASVNPLTGHGQVGSFPSPQRLFFSEEVDPQIEITEQDYLWANGEAPNEASHNPGALISEAVISNLFQDTIFTPGDEFMVLIEDSKVTDPSAKTSDFFYNILSMYGALVFKFFDIRIGTYDQSGKINILERLLWYLNDLDPYYMEYFNSYTENVGGEMELELFRRLVQGTFNVYNTNISGKVCLVFRLLGIQNPSVEVNYSVLDKDHINIFFEISSDKVTHSLWSNNRLDTTTTQLNEFNGELLVNGLNLDTRILDSNGRYAINGAELRGIEIEATCTDSNGNITYQLTKQIISPSGIDYTTQSLPNLIMGTDYEIDSTGLINILGLFTDINTIDPTEIVVISFLDNFIIRNTAAYIKDFLLHPLISLIEGRLTINYFLDLNFTSESGILTYCITPVADTYISAMNLVCGQIDFSKVGSGVLNPTLYTYYVEDDIMSLLFSAEYYPVQGSLISEIYIDFYDFSGDYTSLYEVTETSLPLSGNFSFTLDLILLVETDDLAKRPDDVLLLSTSGNPPYKVPIYMLGTYGGDSTGIYFLTLKNLLLKKNNFYAIRILFVETDYLGVRSFKTDSTIYRFLYTTEIFNDQINTIIDFKDCVAQVALLKNIDTSNINIITIAENNCLGWGAPSKGAEFLDKSNATTQTPGPEIAVVQWSADLVALSGTLGVNTLIDSSLIGSISLEDYYFGNFNSCSVIDYLLSNLITLTSDRLSNWRILEGNTFTGSFSLDIINLISQVKNTIQSEPFTITLAINQQTPCTYSIMTQSKNLTKYAIGYYNTLTTATFEEPVLQRIWDRTDINSQEDRYKLVYGAQRRNYNDRFITHPFDDNLHHLQDYFIASPGRIGMYYINRDAPSLRSWNNTISLWYNDSLWMLLYLSGTAALRGPFDEFLRNGTNSIDDVDMRQLNNNRKNKTFTASNIENLKGADWHSFYADRAQVYIGSINSDEVTYYVNKYKPNAMPLFLPIFITTYEAQRISDHGASLDNRDVSGPEDLGDTAYLQLFLATLDLLLRPSGFIKNLYPRRALNVASGFVLQEANRHFWRVSRYFIDILVHFLEHLFVQKIKPFTHIGKVAQYAEIETYSQILFPFNIDNSNVVYNEDVFTFKTLYNRILSAVEVPFNLEQIFNMLTKDYSDNWLESVKNIFPKVIKGTSVLTDPYSPLITYTDNLKAPVISINICPVPINSFYLAPLATNVLYGFNRNNEKTFKDVRGNNLESNSIYMNLEDSGYFEELCTSPAMLADADGYKGIEAIYDLRAKNLSVLGANVPDGTKIKTSESWWQNILNTATNNKTPYIKVSSVESQTLDNLLLVGFLTNKFTDRTRMGVVLLSDLYLEESSEDSRLLFNKLQDFIGQNLSLVVGEDSDRKLTWSTLNNYAEKRFNWRSYYDGLFWTGYHTFDKGMRINNNLNIIS